MNVLVAEHEKADLISTFARDLGNQTDYLWEMFSTYLLPWLVHISRGYVAFLFGSSDHQVRDFYTREWTIGRSTCHSEKNWHTCAIKYTYNTHAFFLSFCLSTIYCSLPINLRLLLWQFPKTIGDSSGLSAHRMSPFNNFSSCIMTLKHRPPCKLLYAYTFMTLSCASYILLITNGSILLCLKNSSIKQPER